MLKDRIDIYEQVEKEKGYNKKKAKLQQLLRECPTTKYYVKLGR